MGLVPFGTGSCIYMATFQTELLAICQMGPLTNCWNGSKQEGLQKEAAKDALNGGIQRISESILKGE